MNQNVTLELKYGFAKQLSGLSDEQLVARFNGEVGNRGWHHDAYLAPKDNTRETKSSRAATCFSWPTGAISAELEDEF